MNGRLGKQIDEKYRKYLHNPILPFPAVEVIYAGHVQVFYMPKGIALHLSEEHLAFVE